MVLGIEQKARHCTALEHLVKARPRCLQEPTRMLTLGQRGDTYLPGILYSDQLSTLIIALGSTYYYASIIDEETEKSGRKLAF